MADLHTIATPSQVVIDWFDTYRRLKKVVETLRTHGLPLDEREAERSLAYVRKKVSGAPDDETNEVALIDFLGRHGQSLDWVIRGEIGGMICQAAKLSEIA